MPPTDEEYLDTVRAALTALIAELDTARQNGDRGECRRRAEDIRALVARFDEVAGVNVDDLLEMANAAKTRTIRDLGSSAWDASETVEEAKARMGRLPAAPSSGPIAEGAVRRGETITLTFKAPDQCPCGQPITSLAADRFDDTAAVFSAFHSDGSVHRVEGTVESGPRTVALADVAPVPGLRREGTITGTLNWNTDRPAALLTAEELDAIQRAYMDSPVIAHTCGSCGVVNRLTTDTGRDNIIAAGLPRLVAEVRRLRLQQTPGSEPPPTEADLERVLDLALGDMGMVEGDRCVGDKEHAAAQADQADVARVIRGAIRELRRLRSDVANAEDGLRNLLSITSPPPDISGRAMYDRAQAVLAILIKHRDGQ